MSAGPESSDTSQWEIVGVGGQGGWVQVQSSKRERFTEEEIAAVSVVCVCVCVCVSWSAA